MRRRERNLCWGLQEDSTRSQSHRGNIARRLVARCKARCDGANLLRSRGKREEQSVQGRAGASRAVCSEGQSRRSEFQCSAPRAGGTGVDANGADPFRNRVGRYVRRPVGMEGRCGDLPMAGAGG